MNKKNITYILLFLALILFIYYQNNAIKVSTYNIASNKVSKELSGYKIVQLTDLHNKSFGKNQSKLIKKIKPLNPDIIVFTGDLIDAKRNDIKKPVEFMKKLLEIAPVYFVTGNHEWCSNKWDSLEPELRKLGVIILDNTSKEVKTKAENILITGIDDPEKLEGHLSDSSIVKDELTYSVRTFEKYKGFKMLLSHRPELFEEYNQFDLIFSGHAHGGQFIIPFVGGVVAPNQGFFPKYYAGLYKSNDTSMIVSRGLGNSIIPVRIFNYPEIVVVTLSHIK